MIHNGTQRDILVLSQRGAELYELMPYKAPPDMSRYVLSPMPGLLVDVAVRTARRFITLEGDEGHAWLTYTAVSQLEA